MPISILGGKLSMKKLLLIPIMLTSCGTRNIPKTTEITGISINIPVVSSIVDEFFTDADSFNISKESLFNNTHLSINELTEDIWNKTNSTNADNNVPFSLVKGICVKSVNPNTSFKYRNIYIKLSFLSDNKNFPFIQKKVIFHELGHCLLDLNHSVAKENNIMAQGTGIAGGDYMPDAVVEMFLIQDWDNMVSTLFTKPTAP